MTGRKESTTKMKKTKRKKNSIYFKYFRFETLMLFIIAQHTIYRQRMKSTELKRIAKDCFKKKKKKKKANQAEGRDVVHCFYAFFFFASAFLVGFFLLFVRVYFFLLLSLFMLIVNGVGVLFIYFTFEHTHCSHEPSKSSFWSCVF